MTIDSDPFSTSTVLLSELVTENFNFAIIGTIAIIVLLLIISGLISGSEVAYFSLNPQQLQDLEKTGDKTSAKILKHLEKRSDLLASILVANNFVNVAIILIFTSFSEIAFDFSGSPILQFIFEVVVVTSILLLFGEILPKIMAARNPIHFAGIMAQPLKIAYYIFYPIITVLVNSTHIIDKKIRRKGFDISRDELSDAVNLTINSSQPEDEKKILQGIAKFGEIDVSEIMQSRVDVLAIDESTAFPELFEIVSKSSFSRIPVYKSTFDQVVGILYIKDLLPHLKEQADYLWQSLLRDAFFVPENKKINDLLREFQDRKIHMAIVVDEYGGTSGIVTMEDILEEIVGEISDESDTVDEELVFEKIDDSNYLLEGKISLNDLSKIIDVDDRIFDEVKGEADTLAGLILELKEEIPKLNDKIIWNRFTFTIKAVDKRRIKKVHLEIK